MSLGLGSGVSVKWMSGRELKSVTFNARSDGSGNLVFERHLTKVEQRAEDDRGKAVFELVQRTFGPPAT